MPSPGKGGSGPGGFLVPAVAWPWGVAGPRGGASLVWGECGIPACTEADPPVNRITDTCENITLPQLRCRR